MTDLKIAAQNLDGFEKMTLDFVERYGPGFLAQVAPSDIADIAVAFVTYAAPYLSDCIDNFRIYPVGKRDEYRRIAAKGCCGSFDTVIKAKSGRAYMAGFNYGH